MIKYFLPLFIFFGNFLAIFGNETKVKLSDTKPDTGLIVSTMVYYLGDQKYSLQISAYNFLDPKTAFVLLQELVPPTLKLDVKTFTTYESNSRTFSAVALEYPAAHTATFWQSTLNNWINGTTPIYEDISIEYPVSQSPFPLNIAPLTMSRLINKENQLYAFFSNGEVHLIDLQKRQFVFQYSLIPDSFQLDLSFMSFTSYGHLYDAGNDCVWSIAMAGINAYLIKSSLTEKKVITSPTQLHLPNWDNQLIQGGFSTDGYIINMHLAQVEDDKPPRIITIMTAFPGSGGVGFDMVEFLNTETFTFEDINANLMNDGIFFACEESINSCDFLRNSAYDPVSKMLIFQGHLYSAEQSAGAAMIGFMPNKYDGSLTWYTGDYGNYAPFGLSGYQWVQYIQ